MLIYVSADASALAEASASWPNGSGAAGCLASASAVGSGGSGGRSSSGRVAEPPIPADGFQVFGFPSSVWSAVPIMNVAFTAHYNGPRYYFELADRSGPRWRSVVATASLSCLAVYVFPPLLLSPFCILISFSPCCLLPPWLH